MKKCSIFHIFIVLKLVVSGSDYFDDNFDENKNCKQEDLITKLAKSSNDRCASKSRGK